MKVWFPVITGYSGTDVFTRRLASALKTRGIKTEITWFSPYHQFFPSLLKHIPAPTGTDVIHANAWSGFAFKRNHIPLIVTEHQGVFNAKYRQYKNIAQKIYHTAWVRYYVSASLQRASAVTAVSHYTAHGLAQTLSYDTAQVIYNFVNTQVFVPNYQHNGKLFRLLFVGNLSPLKGARMLAPIMKKLDTRFQLKFTSGLKGTKMRPIVENMIPLGGLSNDDDLVKAYQNCDAILFPTRFEGFGYAALEAMACGKPVIASNNSALPEVVKNGVTGILCPTNNIEAFVAACQFLAENPEIGKKYGEAGRARAESLFSEEIIIPQYIALYEKLTMKQQ